MTKNFKLGAISFTIVAVVVGCSAHHVIESHHPQTDDPASTDTATPDLLHAPDFQFTMGDGSGWHGYNVIKITADGKCTYTFAAETTTEPAPDKQITRVQKWRQCSFTLDGKTITDLRQLLVDIDYFRLNKIYSSGLADGTQRWTKVTASGKQKGVYCDNKFPAKMQRIFDFVNDRIIAPQKSAIASATLVDGPAKETEP